MRNLINEIVFTLATICLFSTIHSDCFAKGYTNKVGQKNSRVVRDSQRWVRSGWVSDATKTEKSRKRRILSETKNTDIQKTDNEINCKCSGDTKYLPNVCENKDCEKNFAVMFSTTTCLNCKRVYPIIERLIDQGYIIYVYKLDEEEFKNLGLKSKFNISRYPTFIFFDEGKEVKRASGIYAKESWFKKKLKTRKEQEKEKPTPKPDLIPSNPYDGL